MKNNSGFSLIELMTVIAIFAIMSAIAVPNMIAWRSNHQLNSSAREVLSFITNARIKATKYNTTVNVTVDAAGRQLTSQYVNRAIPVGDPRQPAPEIINLRPQVNIIGITFPGNAFNFNSRGIPNTPGRIILSRTGGHSLDVTLASTGSIRIN